MSEQQPPEKKTVEIEVPPAWAIALTEKVANGFAHVDSCFHTVEANQKLQGGQMLDLGERMTSIESRVGKVENTGSIRAKVNHVSSNDLKQDAAIANVLTKQDEAAAKVDTLTKTVNAIAAKPDTAAVVLKEVREMAGTPTGQKIVGAFVTIILLSMTILIGSLKVKVDAIEAKPASVQPAPTVYLPALADGGAK